MSKLVHFIILLYSVNIFAISNYSDHSFNVADSFKDNELELSSSEKKVSHNFNKLIKLTKRGIINERLLKKLLVDLKKTSIFSSYVDWPESILKVQKTNNIAKLSNYCTNITQRERSTSLEKYLNESAGKICYRKLLKKLAENSNVSMKLHQKFNEVIKEQSPQFFKFHLEIDLKYLLSRFKKNSPAHKLYSQTLESYFISQEAIPQVSLIPYLVITKELTKYLQTKDLNKAATQKIFLKEFRKLSHRILTQGDKNTPHEVINKETALLLNYVASTFSDQPLSSFSKSYLSFGKSLIRRKYYEAARNVFIDMLQRQTPNSKKALFELLWTYTVQQKYQEGLIAIKPFKAIYEDKTDSKITFWVAFSTYKMGEEKKAFADFKELIFKNPLSYYAILASKLLSEKTKGFDTKSIYVSFLEENRSPSSIQFKNLDYDWLKRVLAWGRVANPTLLNLELEDIIKKKSDESLQNHLLAAAYKLSQRSNYLDSFKLIYRFVDRGLLKVNTDVLKILFPLPFIEQIKNKSGDFDPIIALSLIRQESGFNRFAKSRVGARGLMQLMPGTARRFKRSVKKRQLYNSGLNISLGTTYFKKLMSMFDNNLVYSLAAYNAGENRISDWQERDYVNSEESMLKNIENIPFLETRKYVKLIFRNIFFYKMLTEETAKKDTFKFNRIYDIHIGFNK